MIPIIVSNAIMYANLLILLSVGWTLTYMTAKLPNFAYGTFAGVGVYVAFTFAKIWNINPYYALPLGFGVGALLGLFVYKIVLGTLKKYGAGLISLTISTLAIEMIVLASINIYVDWVRENLAGKLGIYTRAFTLRYADFRWMGLPGALIVSTILAASMIIGLHLMLTKTKFGIAMRATVEDIELASVLGINVELVSTVSWVITGGLAGVAGCIIPFWFQAHPDIGTRMMISVMAASVFGGLSSIYGAMLGGYLIGLIEVLLTTALARTIGPWMSGYKLLIPLFVLSITLLEAPAGIVGVIDRVRARGIGLGSRWRSKR